MRHLFTIIYTWKENETTIHAHIHTWDGLPSIIEIKYNYIIVNQLLNYKPTSLVYDDSTSSKIW